MASLRRTKAFLMALAVTATLTLTLVTALPHPPHNLYRNLRALDAGAVNPEPPARELAKRSGCTPGTIRCIGTFKQECTDDGKVWVTVEDCGTRKHDVAAAAFMFTCYPMAPHFGCVEAYKVGMYGLAASGGLYSTPTISPPMAVQATDDAISILPSIVQNAGAALPTADSSVASTSNSDSSSSRSTWTSGAVQVTVQAADASGPTTIHPPTETVYVTSTSTTVVDESISTGVSNSTVTSTPVPSPNVTTTATPTNATATVDTSSAVNSTAANSTAATAPVANGTTSTVSTESEAATSTDLPYCTDEDEVSATVVETTTETGTPASSSFSATSTAQSTGAAGVGHNNAAAVQDVTSTGSSAAATSTVAAVSTNATVSTTPAPLTNGTTPTSTVGPVSNATATASADDECETDAADDEDAQTVTVYVTVHDAGSTVARRTKTVSKTITVADAETTAPPAENATTAAAANSTAQATTTAAINSTATDSQASTIPVNSTSVSSSTEASTDTDVPATASHTLTSSSAEATATGSSNSSVLAAASKTKFSAPHNAIYAFSAFQNDTLPTVAELGKYNRLLLSFYAGSAGQDHNLQVWQNMTAEARNATLEAYHKAGIALIVSAFGSTVTPTTTGLDPKVIGKEIAEYAKQWGFDGVDIDYEDFDAINGGKSSAWLSEFQLTLRDSLGDDYLISHSPIAPWFDNKYYTIDGAYYSVNEKAGSTIDWYNVQFYNQKTAYADCDSLIHNSSSTLWPGTSLLELNSAHGIPLDKLVLGKPLEAAGAVNGGFMDMKTLGGCVAEGKEKGWKPALMFWAWDNTVDPASLLATALSA